MPKVFRKEMIESEILKLMGQALTDWKKEDFPKQNVSFTRVELSRDKRYAKIYVSVFDINNNEKKRQTTFELLEKNSGYFRNIIAKNIRMYTAPEITLVFDKGIEQSVKMQKLLDSLKKEEKETDDAE